MQDMHDATQGLARTLKAPIVFPALAGFLPALHFSRLSAVLRSLLTCLCFRHAMGCHLGSSAWQNGPSCAVGC